MLALPSDLLTEVRASEQAGEGYEQLSSVADQKVVVTKQESAMLPLRTRCCLCRSGSFRPRKTRGENNFVRDST